MFDADADVFLTSKEQTNLDLFIQMRNDDWIITSEKLFEMSDKMKIDNLINREIFSFESFDSIKHQRRIFKSRLVREIKDKFIDASYEKSRLVIQSYQNEKKVTILTQSSTIQRVSQRLIVALISALVLEMNLWLRDINQTYTQSIIKLNKTILAHLSKEIEHLYLENIIMRIIKSLYEVVEIDTHW